MSSLYNKNWIANPKTSPYKCLIKGLLINRYTNPRRLQHRIIIKNRTLSSANPVSSL